MRPTLYTVGLTGGGRVSTMAKPRGADWLADEMSALATEGVRTVVSTLSAAEVFQLDLDGEPDACEAAGMTFVALPIDDRAVPDAAHVDPVLTQLADQVRDGRHVVVHCRFGIGRSSTLAAALLTLNGVQPDDAWDRIAAVRGRPVPDTDAQRRWVDRLHAAD